MSRRFYVQLCLLCIPLFLVVILAPITSFQANSVQESVVSTPPPELLPTYVPTMSPTTSRPTTNPSLSPAICIPGIVTCCIAANDGIIDVFVNEINVTENMFVFSSPGLRDSYIVQFTEPASTSVFAFTGYTELQNGLFAFHCLCSRTISPWNLLISYPPHPDTEIVGPSDPFNYSFPEGWNSVNYIGPVESYTIADLNVSIELSNAATMFPQCAPSASNFSALLIDGVFPQNYWGVRTLVTTEYDCLGV